MCGTCPGDWDPAGLPSLRRGGVTLTDTLTTVVVSLVLAGLLVWHSVDSPLDDGVSLIDPALWAWWTPLVLALLVAEAVVGVAAYRRGRWTPLLATLRTLVAVAFAAPTTWLLVEGALLDPALSSTLGWDPGAIDLVSRVVATAVVLVSLGRGGARPGAPYAARADPAVVRRRPVRPIPEATLAYLGAMTTQTADPAEFLPRRRPSQERSRRRFDDILRAARALLVEVGFEAFTSEQVALRAGVPIGSLYQFFGNKYAIICELDRLDTANVQAELEKFAGEIPTPRLGRSCSRSCSTTSRRCGAPTRRAARSGWRCRPPRRPGRSPPSTSASSPPRSPASWRR